MIDQTAFENSVVVLDQTYQETALSPLDMTEMPSSTLTDTKLLGFHMNNSVLHA